MSPEQHIPLKTVITYARSAAGCTESLESQRKSITAFCKARELVIARHVEEVGAGTTVSRPGIRSVLNAIEDDMEIQAVVVDGLDRLSRSMVQCIAFQHFLERKGLKLIDISGRPETPDLAMTKAFWDFFREAELLVNEAAHEAADSGIDSAAGVDTVE